MNSDKITRLASMQLDREGIHSTRGDGYLIIERFIRIETWLKTHKRTARKFKI